MKYPGKISWPSFPGVERWLNALGAHSHANEVLPGVGYRVKRQVNGTILEILAKPGTSAETDDDDDDFTFTTDGLDLTLVNGGVIFRHNVDLIVPDGVDTPVTLTIPSSQTKYCIWLIMSNEFAVTPTLTWGQGTSVTASLSPPARKYLLIAWIDSDSTRITKVRRHFRGGAWPSIFDFHQ